MISTAERRRYPRFAVSLPFRLRLAAGKDISGVMTFLTRDISKAGLCFLAPRRPEPGQSIKVEVTLAGYGLHGKDVNISGVGYIVRAEAGGESGWYRVAAAFDETSSGQGPSWGQLAAASPSELLGRARL